MLELEKPKYDPRVYGDLRANFLNKVNSTPYILLPFAETENQKLRRQELLKKMTNKKPR